MNDKKKKSGRECTVMYLWRGMPSCLLRRVAKPTPGGFLQHEPRTGRPKTNQNKHSTLSGLSRSSPQSQPAGFFQFDGVTGCEGIEGLLIGVIGGLVGVRG